MVLRDALWMQGGSYSADEDRILLQNLFGEGIWGDGFVVSQRAAGTNMSVDVASGTCTILGDDTAEQGLYLCESTGTENVTLDAAPGVGNSRIDRIVAQVRDGTVLGNSTHDWIVTKVTGTPSASPSAPALPSSAISLALVEVDHGTAAVTDAMITDDRDYGGVKSFALRYNAVTSNHLAAGAVNAAAVGAGAVTDFGLANDAVVAGKIADNAVTAGTIADEAVTAANIAAEAWTAYTPDQNGVFLGTGALTARYYQIGKTVHCCGRLLFGGTTAVTAPGAALSLPVPAAGTGSNPRYTGAAYYFDDSTGRHWVGTCLGGFVAQDGLYFIQQAAGSDGLVGSDDPFTWAADDVLIWSITYEAD